MSDAAKDLAKRRSIHEAAHAVVGMALGLKLVRLTIDDATFEPRDKKMPPRAESMPMLWAGVLAETRYGVDEKLTMQSGRLDMACINEIAAARTSAPEDVPPLIASARAQATDLVNERWDDIRGLAFVLREVGDTMDGRAVRIALRRLHYQERRSDAGLRDRSAAAGRPRG
jgi:hypothetical protein